MLDCLTGTTTGQTADITIEKMSAMLAELELLHPKPPDAVIVGTPKGLARLPRQCRPKAKTHSIFATFDGIPVYEEPDNGGVVTRTYKLRKEGKRVFSLYDPE